MKKAVRNYRQTSREVAMGTLTVGEALNHAIKEVEGNATIKPNTKEKERLGNL